MTWFTNEETGKRLDLANYTTRKELEKQQQILIRKENTRKGKVKEFIACFHTSIKAVTQHLSLTESGAIMKLLLYMKMNGEGLLQKEGKPLKQLDIQKILGKGKTQTVAIVKKLEYLSILISVKEGRSKHFFINGELHYMGKLAVKSFTKLMKTKLSEVVDDLKLEQLGFLYKILPYFHYDNCYLAHNPNESELTKIKYMNRKELANIINYDVDNVTSLVNQLRRKGLIMTTNTSGSVLYRVHPDLMYRQDNDGNNDKMNAIRDDFETHQIEANRRKGDK